MRCRAGDLAEIVSAGQHAANLVGVRIVVTCPVPRPKDGVACWAYAAMHGGPLRSIDGRPVDILEDHNLRPIRGNEHCEPDAVVQRVGKPRAAALDLDEVPQQ